VITSADVTPAEQAAAETLAGYNILDYGLRSIWIDPISLAPLGYHVVSRFSSVEDGTTNQLAVGEKFRRDVDTNYITQVATTTPIEFVGSYWVGTAPDTRAASTMTQNRPVPSGTTFMGSSINSFASEHPGGGHFMLTDGSVRFVSENTDQNLIFQMGIANDGQITVLD
jgi:hypothetical protein